MFLVEACWDRGNQERLWGAWAPCTHRSIPRRREVHGCPRWRRSCHPRQKGIIFRYNNKTLFMILEFHVMIVFCRDLVELLSRRLIKPLSLASTMSQWLEVNATWLWRGSAITLSSLISKFTLSRSASNQFEFKVLLY